MFVAVECYFGTDADHKSAKFCPECGCAKEDASRVCLKYKKDQETISEYRQISQEMLELVPYPEQTSASYDKQLVQQRLRETWADYFAIVVKQINHTLFGRWDRFSSRTIPLKLADGSWGTQKVDYPPLRGSIEQITSIKQGQYGRQYYWQREWAEMVLDRLSKKRYLSAKQFESIVSHLIAKHGRHNGQYYCLGYQDSRSVNIEYANFASGPFCPVNLGVPGPAYKEVCRVCNEGIASGVIYPSQSYDGRLYEEWPDTREINWFAAVCGSSVCEEVADWLEQKNKVLVEEAKKYQIPQNRPAKVTLEKYPEELRGSLILSRYLDFQARYTEKMNTVTDND